MKKFILLCICAILTAGCFGGRSPDSTFFILQKDAKIKPISSKSTSILVGQITIPDLIYKPQIVLNEKTTSEIKISEFNRWAEPLPDIIRQTLTDNLQSYLPNAYIKPELYSTSVSGYQYFLNVEVNHFIGTFNGEAILDVWWTLKDKNGKIKLREKASFNTSMGDTYQSYVIAQNNLLAKLSFQIAEKISKQY